MIFKRKKNSVYFHVFCGVASIAYIAILYFDRENLSFFYAGYFIIALHLLANMYYSLKYPLLEIKEDEIIQYELLAKKTIKIENLVRIKYLVGDFIFEDKSGKKIRIDKSRFNKTEIPDLEQKINEFEELLKTSTETQLIHN